MHFHSDKDTLSAITAQSSPAKEKKNLDKVIKSLDFEDEIKAQLYAENDMHTESLAKVEFRLKKVQKEAGNFFSKMDNSDLNNVLSNIKGDKDSDGNVTMTDADNPTIKDKTSTKWKDATKKKFLPAGKFGNYLSDDTKNNWNNMSDNEKEREQLRAFFNFMGDSPEERAEKLEEKYNQDNPIVSTADEDSLLDRINAKYRKEGSPDTYGDIEEIRKEHARVEKEHYDELNQFYVGDTPLGQYYEGNSVFEQFHLEAVNPNSKKGVHAYPGLFETNHGGISIDGSVLRDVFDIKSNKDFVTEFAYETQGQKGSSGAMKGRITGETRNVYLLIKDKEGKEKEKIYIGEKRLRTKAGKMGKLQTVYKWHPDAIKKFKEKGKRT
jgi:hypothetical protein